MTIVPPFNAAVKICLPSPLHAFNDEAWNADAVTLTTNCYAYALNDTRIGWAIPGHLLHSAGVYEPEYAHMTSFMMRRGLLQDGLIEITRDQALSGQFHALALRVAYRKGFHVYRLGDDGLWHQKNGPRPVDMSDPPVPDPETVQSPWEEFGGYYAIPEEGVRFVPQVIRN